MFNFARDDNGGFIVRCGPNRLQSLKHNPYVGSFTHAMVRSNTQVGGNDDMRLGNRNPLIGTFRHSPPVTILSQGIKPYQWEAQRLPLFTQIQAAVRDNKYLNHHISISDLQKIPVSTFINSSSITPRDLSDDNFPQCAICLERFVDGDELRTLSCSHCYHRKCIDVWLLGCLSNESTVTSNCPNCRRTAAPSQEVGHQSPSSSCDGIVGSCEAGSGTGSGGGESDESTASSEWESESGFRQGDESEAHDQLSVLGADVDSHQPHTTQDDHPSGGTGNGSHGCVDNKNIHSALDTEQQNRHIAHVEATHKSSSITLNINPDEDPGDIDIEVDAEAEYPVQTIMFVGDEEDDSPILSFLRIGQYLTASVIDGVTPPLSFTDSCSNADSTAGAAGAFSFDDGDGCGSSGVDGGGGNINKINRSVAKTGVERGTYTGMTMGSDIETGAESGEEWGRKVRRKKVLGHSFKGTASGMSVSSSIYSNQSQHSPKNSNNVSHSLHNSSDSLDVDIDLVDREEVGGGEREKRRGVNLRGLAVEGRDVADNGWVGVSAGDHDDHGSESESNYSDCGYPLDSPALLSDYSQPRSPPARLTARPPAAPIPSTFGPSGTVPVPPHQRPLMLASLTSSSRHTGKPASHLPPRHVYPFPPPSLP